MGKRILILWLILLLADGLSAQPNNGNILRQAFKLPGIPAGLTEPAERAAYLSLHYWENFCFTDTSVLHRPQDTEQAFVDFIQVLPYTSLTIAGQGIISLLDKAMGADSLLFSRFAELCEKYLYSPDSPMYNEELYIPALRYITASSKIGALDKVRPLYQLELALKNRTGTIATDFTYTLANGKKGKLSDIKAEYLLIFFNDPDCNKCLEMKEYLCRSGLSRDRTKEELSILTLYPGEDLQNRHQEKYPEKWLNGYDGGNIRRHNLYDLSSMPTIYLLDREKRILLKNTSIEKIETFFQAGSSDTNNR